MTITPSIIPHKRDVDLNRLHPIIRDKVIKVQNDLANQNIPIRIFEAYREPERQAYLYAQGRTIGGAIVTNCKPWQSYHQYGLAVDFVLFLNNTWSWSSSEKNNKHWQAYHEIARAHGLETSSSETPHIQCPDTSSTQLMNGEYPDNGDESWAESLSTAISRWNVGQTPAYPNIGVDIKPPMKFDYSSTDFTQNDWHSRFGGDYWHFDANGVYTQNHDGSQKIWRTPGTPHTTMEIIGSYKKEIEAASKKHDVPQSLIIMTIATQTAAFRKHRFTGAKTFNWQQHVSLSDTGDANLDGKQKGDYNAGPMQLLSNTARSMNKLKKLGYSENELKWFENKPSKNPESLGLYDAKISIDIGTAYIAHNRAKTGDDPILVAAAYNAGSLRPFSGNHWRLECYGNHIDRAAQWYGDACAVLNGSP